MLNRRNFLKKTALASGTAMAVKPIKALSSRQQTSSDYFGVHEFIENNPNAVFIMKTNVDVKTNFDAKVSAALDFSRSVFVPKAEEDGGVPITHTIALKPNLTWAQQTNSKATVEGCRGIVTDPEFMDGMIQGMIELGLSANQFHARDKWAEG